jgi:multidrug efflux pump subunit AcrA (membrane-fusion protein)
MPVLPACRSLDLAALMRATSGGELILRRRTMALTGRTDTETSGLHMTLGREALDHGQGPVTEDLDHGQGPVTEDQVREQQAPEEAEEQAGSTPSAAAPAKPAVSGAGGPNRRPVTAPQIVGGILIAAIVVAAAVWYVPRIARSDSRSFTGSVSSSGVTNLNFANAGLVGRVPVQPGQAVKAGQVLATETSPATTAAISADHASIAADQANLAQLKATASTTSTQASIAAAGAQLAQDQAQLASDKVKLAETQIIAPSAGTVIAISGQTGETVTAAGIRSYSSPTQSSGTQSPPFSLLPEGPAANVKSSSTQSALPMIALRTSGTWQVTVLVPESEIQQVHSGQAVTVAVPAVGLSGVRGTIQQVSPTPVSTSIGTAYQAIVRISGHQRVTPLGGMTANVQLGS